MGKPRKEKIFSIISDSGFASVQELMRYFDVSDETIRRDLRSMEKDGKIKRIHGGAVIASSQTKEVNYQKRQTLLLDEKREMAREAATLIDNGDTIIVLSGTSTLALVEFLKEKEQLTVITNSILLALELAKCPSIKTYCIGGCVRAGNFSISGTISERDADLFNAKKLVMGIGGISLAYGFADHYLEDATLVRTCVQRAGQVIVLADHSKFNVEAQYNSCDLSSVTHLVTSDLAPAFLQEHCRQSGIEVHAVHVDEHAAEDIASISSWAGLFEDSQSMQGAADENRVSGN